MRQLFRGRCGLHGSSAIERQASSHGGTNLVRRKGLLDEIPRVRLNRGVILVRTGDAGTATRFLEEMGAEVPLRTVTWAKIDREARGV